MTYSDENPPTEPEQKPTPTVIEVSEGPEKGKFLIECPVCGFGVVRNEGYILTLPNMKCPHCFTRYSVVKV